MNHSTFQFLGRDSGFGNKNNSVYYEDKEKFFLIDCGFTVFQQIKEKFDFSKYKEINIIITHLHNDHAGSLSQFILYLWFVYHIKATVISKCAKIKDYLDITGTPKEAYELESNFKNLEFIKTEHSPYLDAYGFKITLNNKNIVYTGDSSTIQPFMPYLKDINELYIDVSKNGGVHIKIDDELELLTKLKNSKINIILMHLDDKEYIKKVTKNEFFID